MNSLAKYNPFEELRALQRQLFDNPFTTTLSQAVATDVYTVDNTLVVEAHVPNFAEEDLDVSLDNGALVIRGETLRTNSVTMSFVRAAQASAVVYRYQMVAMLSRLRPIWRTAS